MRVGAPGGGTIASATIGDMGVDRNLLEGRIGDGEMMERRTKNVYIQRRKHKATEAQRIVHFLVRFFFCGLPTVPSRCARTAMKLDELGGNVSKFIPALPQGASRPHAQCWVHWKRKTYSVVQRCSMRPPNYSLSSHSSPQTHTPVSSLKPLLLPSQLLVRSLDPTCSPPVL